MSIGKILTRLADPDTGYAQVRKYNHDTGREHRIEVIETLCSGMNKESQPVEIYGVSTVESYRECVAEVSWRRLLLSGRE